MVLDMPPTRFPEHPDISDWLRWLQAGDLSPATVRQRAGLIAAFAEQYDPATATPEQLAFFISQRPGGAWSKAGYVSTLRSFYRWLHLSGRRHDNPAALLRSVKTPRPVPHPCPEEVLARALENAGDQVRFMLLLGAYAGLRRSEIASLHSTDVTPTHLEITGKGRVTRRIPIHPRLAPHLHFDGWAFPSRRNIGEHISHDSVADMVAAALGGGWTCHSLRHRFATQAYHGTTDLRAVQELLGHAEPATTAGYTSINDDAMRRAVLSVA